VVSDGATSWTCFVRFGLFNTNGPLVIHVVMFQERCLLMPMFEQPGSDIKTVIINEDVVRNKGAAVYVYDDLALRQSSGV